MFSVPLFPPIPPFLVPSALLAPLKAFFTQPTTIDYTSIPLLRATPATARKASTAAHAGPLASLPKSTCPICHLRFTSAPVPLDSSSASGSAINLPPIQSVFSTESPEVESREETRIFVPAQTDCWGGCRWCYYCVAGELAKHRDATEARRKTSRSEEESGEGEAKWSCLRCGGGATRAWRVSAAVRVGQPIEDSSIVIAS